MDGISRVKSGTETENEAGSQSRGAVTGYLQGSNGASLMRG